MCNPIGIWMKPAHRCSTGGEREDLKTTLTRAGAHCFPPSSYWLTHIVPLLLPLLHLSPLPGTTHLNPEDGGSKVLWNVGILPQYCTLSQLHSNFLYSYLKIHTAKSTVTHFFQWTPWNIPHVPKGFVNHSFGTTALNNFCLLYRSHIASDVTENWWQWFLSESISQ
jgi:hypothetical protein